MTEGVSGKAMHDEGVCRYQAGVEVPVVRTWHKLFYLSRVSEGDCDVESYRAIR